MADYREFHIKQKPNVDIYLDSELNGAAILEFGFEHVCLATGSEWRRDGVSRQHVVPMPIREAAKVFTPDDIMSGALPSGHVVIYDDDHYYMGGVLAELLVSSQWVSGDFCHAFGIRFRLDRQHTRTTFDPPPIGGTWCENCIEQGSNGNCGGSCYIQLRFHRYDRAI